MNSPRILSRRLALKTLGAGAATLSLSSLAPRALAAAGGKADAKSAGGSQPFSLPKLAYAYAALEPHIDAQTMEIHHSKHHQSYITNANNALKNHPALQKLSAEDMLRDLNALPTAVRTTLRNNVGGHVNHTFFWKVIGPRAGGAPSGPLGDALKKEFGSFEQFKEKFASAAAARFGSGWAWLTIKDGKLAISSTANQDNPISAGATPLLGLDVWEHAYYLKYQNRRADYTAAFWNVVNWNEVAANLAKAS
jgi:superoxide dismutase, Fe-Mn family